MPGGGITRRSKEISNRVLLSTLRLAALAPAAQQPIWRFSAAAVYCVQSAYLLAGK